MQHNCAWVALTTAIFVALITNLMLYFMKKIILSIIVACLLITHANAQVTVLGSATQDGVYATLGAAITAIGTSQSGQTIDIAISASTAEALTGVTIGAGDWTKLTIYPTADNVSIAFTTGTPSAPLIKLSGANYVTIKGRKNKTGASTLTLSNSGTKATVNFTGDATHAAQNNKIEYCTITGGTAANDGILSFGATATIANGYGLNTIDHNLITNNGTRPFNAIYSLGNTLSWNTGNIITNNEFKDCLNWGAASQIINLSSISFNTGWTIKGNKFYDTGSATCNSSVSIINVQIGTGYDISDNVIGGSASDNSGTWTKSSNNSSAFIAINLASATTGGTASTIQNNTIKNFSWTNSTGGTWTGILVGGASAATIGGNTTALGNKIGDNTTTGSITTSNGAVNGVVTGISITSTSAVDCLNNKIGSITANSTGFVVAINAINKGTQAGNTNISNNIIGSSSVDNSIYSSTNIASQNVKGILCTGTGTNTISNNEIGSLTTGSTSGVVNAIDLGAGTNTVNANLIYNLSSPNSTATGLNGINLPAGGTNTCSNNIISLGNNYANTIAGINELLSTTPTNLYHNSIFITGTPTSVTLNSFGINSLSTSNTRNIKNNIIFNNRVNGTGATGKNYAINLATYASGALACNYNDLYVTTAPDNSVGKYTTGKVDLAAWQGISIAPDANSVSGDPGFASPDKTALSYKGTAFFAGTPISGIASDYGGYTRGSNMGAWDLPITWNGTAWSATPSASLNAIINGTYSNAGFTCLNLTINAGKQVTISSGILSVLGNLTLKSDAINGTATFIDNGGTLSVTGTSTVQQYLNADHSRNWYISSPVSTATAQSGYTYSKRSEPTNGWTAMNTGDALTPGKGYIANPATAQGTYSFTGGSLNTGNVPVTLGYSGSGVTKGGFNLVGNPYSSHTTLTYAATVAANALNTIWYRTVDSWDANALPTPKYVYAFKTCLINSDNSYIGTPSGTTPIIAPMQAFWVRTSVDASTLTFTNAMRSHQSSNPLKAPAKKDENMQLLRLQVSNGTNTDETVLYSNVNASNSFDEYDAPKMFNNSVSMAEIYTLAGNEQLAINGLNAITNDTEIQIGFSTLSSGTYSIKASQLSNFDAGTKVILKDYLDPNNPVVTDLSDGSSYSFTSDVSSNNISRFTLLFKAPSVATIINPENNSNVWISTRNGQIVVNGSAATGATLEVFNTVGQKVISRNLTGTNVQLNDNIAPGAYLVRLTNEGKSITRKIIID